MTVQDVENRYASGLYTKRPLTIVRGQGARLWDSDGNTYPLAYALTLQARAGRWEVAALDDAPALGPSSTPSAVPSTPTTSDDSATASPSPSAS